MTVIVKATMMFMDIFSTLPRVEFEEEARDLMGHSQDSSSSKLASENVASNLT